MEYDEVNVGREEETAPKDSLATIYHGLRRRNESAAEAGLALGQMLEHMTKCAIRGDTEGLHRWYETCRRLIAKVDKGESE